MTIARQYLSQIAARSLPRLLQPVLHRTDRHKLPEDLAEMAVIVEAGGIGDGLHRVIGVDQEILCFVNTHLENVFMERTARLLLEARLYFFFTQGDFDGQMLGGDLIPVMYIDIKHRFFDAGHVGPCEAEDFGWYHRSVLACEKIVIPNWSGSFGVTRIGHGHSGSCRVVPDHAGSLLIPLHLS